MDDDIPELDADDQLLNAGMSGIVINHNYMDYAGNSNSTSTSSSSSNQNNKADTSSIVDELEAVGMLEEDDDSAIHSSSSSKPSSSTSAAGQSNSKSSINSNMGGRTSNSNNAGTISIVKTRTYDLSIVYDKYYQTPRVFLFGYDEYRNPLTAEQIMQDISSDHANKTVDIQTHPHTGLPHASIHPCRHAEVMKRMLDQLLQREVARITNADEAEAREKEKLLSAREKELSRYGNVVRDNSSVKGSSANGGTSTKSILERAVEAQRQTITVDYYMILFLKFISAVIPTVEYDFTASMNL
jgi:ubiquitin-like-conjugating enzyme ATG3